MRKFFERLCDRFALVWVLLTSPPEIVPDNKPLKFMKNLYYLAKEFWRSLVFSLILCIAFCWSSSIVSKVSTKLGIPGQSSIVNILDSLASVFLCLFIGELAMIAVWPTVARYFTQGRPAEGGGEDVGMQKATVDSWAKGFAELTPVGRLYYCTSVLLGLCLLAAIATRR